MVEGVTRILYIYYVYREKESERGGIWQAHGLVFFFTTHMPVRKMRNDIHAKITLYTRARSVWQSKYETDRLVAPRITKLYFMIQK